MTSEKQALRRKSTVFFVVLKWKEKPNARDTGRESLVSPIVRRTLIREGEIKQGRREGNKEAQEKGRKKGQRMVKPFPLCSRFFTYFLVLPFFETTTSLQNFREITYKNDVHVVPPLSPRKIDSIHASIQDPLQILCIPRLRRDSRASISGVPSC